MKISKTFFEGVIKFWNFLELNRERRMSNKIRNFCSHHFVTLIKTSDNYNNDFDYVIINLIRKVDGTINYQNQRNVDSIGKTVFECEICKEKFEQDQFDNFKNGMEQIAKIFSTKEVIKRVDKKNKLQSKAIKINTKLFKNRIILILILRGYLLYSWYLCLLAFH